MDELIKRLRNRAAKQDKEGDMHVMREAADALEAANDRIGGLESARIAYASEFAPDAEGLPDVGSIHANIRAMKAQIAAVAPAVDAQPVAEAWQPISTAPDDQLVVVGWLDPEDMEHPERHDFDYREEGVWVKHADNYEHFCCVAPPGSRGPSEEPPYTHWMRILPIPRSQP